MMRYLLTLSTLLFFANLGLAQKSNVRGVVTDPDLKEPLIGATVKVLKGGSEERGAVTNIDGEYNISGLDPGTYDLEVSYLGYQTQRQTGVLLKSGQLLELNIELKSDEGGTLIEEVVIRSERPLIELGETGGKTVFDAEAIKNRGTRNLGTLTGAAAAVVQTDEGQATYAGGARGDGNEIFIDGVRVRGNVGLSDLEADQVEVMTGGLSAVYGDATGSITNIVTKAPSAKYGGYISLESSQFLDAFGQNRIDVGISGPIWTRPVKDEKGELIVNKKTGKVTRESVLGFRLSASMFTSLDNSPSALGSYKLKDDVLSSLEADPLYVAGDNLLRARANLLTAGDLEETSVRPNNRDMSFQGNGTLYFRINQNIQFRLGGQFFLNRDRNAGDGYRLLNADRNPLNKGYDWRVRAEFRHVVPTSDESFLTNMQYTIQADYTRNYRFVQDDVHQDKFFHYGYIGEFREQLSPTYALQFDPVLNDVKFVHESFLEQFIGYTPNMDINPLLANYNLHVTEAFDSVDIDRLAFPMYNGTFSNLFSNTQQDLHTNTGIVFNNYSKSQFNQLGIRTNVGFDLAKKGSKSRHSISLGFVFEQRVDRNYSLAPVELWRLADQYANRHIARDPDTTLAPIRYDTVPNPFTNNDDIVPIYPAGLSGTDGESYFSRQLRAQLGITDSREWINVFALSPDLMTLDMFESEELTNQSVVNYYGYDYLGNPLSTSVTFDDFFKPENRRNRKVGPNAPVYGAAYIEDNFRFKDILFRVGVRADYYDANTKVLRDDYSLYGAYTAGELRDPSVETRYTRIRNNAESALPSSIGDDFMVYVDDPADPEGANVIGFRSGDEWFNAQGVAITSPDIIGNGGSPIPARKDYSSDISLINNFPDQFNPDFSFRDYKPSLIVSPRLAFSFPINDMAQFYAHYDVVAQRPPSNTLATALDYFNFNRKATSSDQGARLFNNPALKPQRKINYEVGYEQAIGERTRVKLSMYYNEFRDFIQVRNHYRAYPYSYESFANNDFATSKGFTFEYELRRTGNIRILANYTLQFADGTGSNSTATRFFTQVLRQPLPLDYDQRHAFYINFDYRYGSGKEYNGPVLFGSDIFSNLGANFEFNIGSGTPYTRKAIAGQFGGSQTQGSLNGSRLPWNFRVDFKIDKDFRLSKADNPNQVLLNVYFRIQNLFNTRNVLSVYPFTGSPYDDGYLTDPGGNGPDLLSTIADVSSVDSFVALYNLRMLNPGNISLPRRIFFGATLQF